jgi:pimeloyl-ACP methyl ester carboxylesterase
MLPKLVSDETRAQRPEVVEEVRRIASAQPTAAIVAALQALRDRPDAGPVLETIRVPTLVVVGSEDQLTPPAMSEALARNIRGARPVSIPGAGHLSNLERPEPFNAEVASFLRSLP